MFNLYILEDHYGTPHIMSSSKIHKRVMDDSSKSNYNWIASATDLINVCNKRTFPVEKANDIKVAILNCYSSFLWDERAFSSDELNSVCYAYNSLYGVEDEKVLKARAQFLRAFLSSITYSSGIGLFHHGEKFKNSREEWKNQKYEELISEKNVDFASLYSILMQDFSKKIKKLEENGFFYEEDKAEQEIVQSYMQESVKHLFEQSGEQNKLVKSLQRKNNV